MTAIEQTVDKIEDTLKAFRQNNRSEDYGVLLEVLQITVQEWLVQHVKETLQ